jgi:hypothetical protein
MRRKSVEVRIGVVHTAKEIDIDLGDSADPESVKAEVTAVLDGRSDKPAVLWLTDRRGRTIGIPAEKISYVEIGADATERRVGFIG